MSLCMAKAIKDERDKAAYIVTTKAINLFNPLVLTNTT